MRLGLSIILLSLLSSSCSTGSALIFNSAMRQSFNDDGKEGGATDQEKKAVEKPQAAPAKPLSPRLGMASGYLVQCVADTDARLRVNHRAAKCSLQSDKGALVFDTASYEIVPKIIKADGNPLSPGEKKLVEIIKSSAPLQWGIVYRLGTSPLGFKLTVTRRKDGVSEEIGTPLSQ